MGRRVKIAAAEIDNADGMDMNIEKAGKYEPAVCVLNSRFGSNEFGSLGIVAGKDDLAVAYRKRLDCPTRAVFRINVAVCEDEICWLSTGCRPTRVLRCPSSRAASPGGRLQTDRQ